MFNPDGSLKTAASAECRTSDITLAEFKTLQGKMDGFNPRGTTIAEYMDGSQTQAVGWPSYPLIENLPVCNLCETIPGLDDNACSSLSRAIRCGREVFILICS